MEKTKQQQKTEEIINVIEERYVCRCCGKAVEDISWPIFDYIQDLCYNCSILKDKETERWVLNLK